MKEHYARLTPFAGALAVLLLVGAGCGAASTNNHSNDRMAANDAMPEEMAMKENMDETKEMQKENTAPIAQNQAAPAVTQASAGMYTEYADDKLAMADTGDVVLFFHAAWCSSCKSLEEDINANLDNIPENVTLLKVDYDTAVEMKRKYNVTMQHTFVHVDKNGNEIKQWKGGNTLDAVLEKLGSDNMASSENANAGSYDVYSDSRLASANDNVVLFFHAAWCSSCKTLEKDINNNLDAIPAGVTLLKVDYDTATELRQKYGVTTQHTIVQVDNEGNEIKQWKGGNSLESIVAELEA